MVKFAREAEAAGWAVALRAGTVDAADGESSLGVWECEASGTAHDSRQGGESLAVLSLMWTQEDGRERWTFDSERSGAEFGGRILTGYVTLEDYQRVLSQARVRQVDPVAEAAKTAAREAAERAELEATDAAQRAEYAADAAQYARQWERATDQQAERFGEWVADSDVLWLGDYAAAWRTWSPTESAAAEAYAAVMAECRVHRDEISRLWSVDRMEREHVPHAAALARELAESATREVKTLLTRAAEAEGTLGAADMIRREVLPALVSAREAVEAYDAHRSKETREHTLKAADADQVRPVVAVPQSDAAVDAPAPVAPAVSTAASDIDTDAVTGGTALVDRALSEIEWHRDAPESSAPVDLVTLAREAAGRGWSVKVGRSMTGREGLGWALSLSGEVAVSAGEPVTVVYTGMWTGRPKFHRAVKRVGSTRMDRPLMWPEFRKVVRTAELVTTAPEADKGDAPQTARVATLGETIDRGIAPRADEDPHSHLGGSGMLGADAVRRTYERADQGDGAPVAEWAAAVGLHRVPAVDQDLTQGRTTVPGCCARCIRSDAPDMWTVADGRLLCGQCADTVLPAGWIRGAVRVQQGAPVAFAADVVSDPGGVDAWESEGGVLEGGGRPLLICHGKGGGVFPVAFRGPYEGTVRLSRDVRLRTVRGQLAVARDRVESAEFIARERAAWSADMREVEREARRNAGVLGDHVWLSAEHAGDWRAHAHDVALAADRAAWNARDAVRALEREESAIVTEQGLAGERVAAVGAHLARLHAGEVLAGRGAWLSEDGEAAMVFTLPWDASHDVEQIPGGVPADQITGYAAFIDVLGDAVAARDERRPLTAKDVPGRNRMGGHGPDTDLRRAIVKASKGLDAKPWKAPKVPEAGTPLDAETLATWDTVGGVVAETETAPGVWLPMAAVSLAEVSMANGWTVAMQRDGGTVAVRVAGVAVKNGEPLPYELRAVWIDGVWNEDQSGAWVSGRRVTAKRALLWSAPVKVGRSGTHQEPSLLSTVQHKAEPGTLGVRTPEWSEPPPAGVSDPGSIEGWEGEGGVLADGGAALVEHPGVIAAAASTDESLIQDGAPVEPVPVSEVTAVSTDEHGVSMWEITGDARGQLTMGAEVKVPGSAVWLRVESVRLAHGGWCEVSGTAVNGMGAGRPWVSERVDHSDRSVPYVVARGHRPPVNAPKAPEATTALDKPIDAGVSRGQTNEEVQADHGAPASAAEKSVGQDTTTDQPDGTGTSATSQDDGREQQHESAPEESPSQDAPASDGDGLGTVDLFESFGLTRTDRVPALAPQEEPAPETDAASTGVEEGQVTVEKVQSEAAAAEPDTGIVDERGLTAAGWRSLAHAADLDAAAVLRHYEPLLEVVGLSGSDAVSYLTGETALDDGRYDSDTPYQRLMDDIGRRADRVGGISERGRVVTMRDVSEGRSTLHRHLMNLTLGVDDVRQGREEPLGIDLAAILADPDSRFALPDDPQWRLAAAVPTGKVVVAHDPETGYAVFNTYRRRKAGEVLREQRFWWDRDAVPEGVWRPRTDQSEDEQHQAVRELLAALTAAGIDHAVHGQVFTHSEDPVRHEPVPSPELQKEPEPKTDNVPIEQLAEDPIREDTDGPAEHPGAAGEPAPPSGPDDQQPTAGDTPAEESTGGERAETSAQVLAGMPRNAGVLFHEAADRGWDVRAERHWTGRAWARRIVITGLVMVPKGVEEEEHVAAWSEDKGGYMSSASSAGFKDVRSAVAAQTPVSREAEESGRTVLGRDAATWVREMNTAAAKITASLADVRDAYNALDGTGPVGRRAVEIAGAAYREAADAERRAVDAVKAARAWLADSNGEDARGCAAWRRVIVLATKRVTDAAETIAGAVDRAECEELAAPVIAEAQDRLNAEEAAWRERLATEGRTPTARGYGSLIYMLEDSERDWAAWFDGYTDNNGVAHAPRGDASLSMVAQYDAWKAENAARSNGRQVSFPSRYTYASNLASDRQDAAAVAFALAVGEHIAAPDDDDVSSMGRGTRALLADIAAVRRNPEGFATANERKHLAEWVKSPHSDNYRPKAAGFAEHAPDLWEAYETAARAYAGVQHFRHALVWDRKYAAERAEEIREADAEGLTGLTAAREARRVSGREAEEWAAAVERFTTARVRVHEASVLAAGDVERAEECGERVRESDALADDVWSAVRFCREAYDEVHRAKRDADHYAKSAEIYREAGRLADYVAECVRMEDAAQRAESGREETVNLYGCAFEDATRAEETRQTACAEDVAGQVAAAVEVIAFHQSPGVVGRVVCQCGAVHAGYFPLRSRGLQGEQPSGMADLTDWDIDDALAARGLAASADRDQWSRGVLVTTEDGTAGFATRIPVTMDRRAAEAYEASRAERQEAAQAAPAEERAPEVLDDRETAEEGRAPADLSPLWTREAVEVRTQAIEFAAKGKRQPKGSPVRPVEGERGVWECGGRFYSVSNNGRDESLWGDGYPNTVHDITEVRARRGRFGPAAPIIGHAHGTADAQKLIRMYAREVVALIADQEAEAAEAAREAEGERITSQSGTELPAEQLERADGMAAAVADATGPSGELARRTAAAELAAAEAHASRYDTPQADAETDGQETAEDAETEGHGAQLRAALIEGETIAPVSFTDRREPATGWILTTAGGHTFRLRPVTYSRPDEDQWEAGHDADGSHWWAANVEDRPLTAVLARIREDSATRTRFASLWARYGHLTAQAPQFETTTDRVQLEEGVYLVRRFGCIGLIASCRWGWEHLTDPDGAQGRTGEDWSRRGADNRQYVAEWKIWNRAEGAIPNARLRVMAQLTDDMSGTPDAYCDASAPYVGKCSAKRSGARYTVAVVTDQGNELGRYTVCARCLSHRLLNEVDGLDGRTGHRDVQSLARDLAKGDPKVCALHWQQWPDRIAEVAGQMLSAALDAGEVAPWPAQALADQIIAEACEAGDDRAKREARAAVKAAGGDAKAQKRAAEQAAEARQDRAALVAGQGAAGRAFSARIRAESASKETVRHLEAGDRAKAEEAAGEASEWASVAIEAAEAATAAGYRPTEDKARADMEAANEAARAAVATLAGLAGSRVEESDAASEPAEEPPGVVDVNALTVTPQNRNGEPSRYEFTVTGPGLTVGEYEISHDCQGKNAQGIMWRAYWHGVEPSGRWDVISIGSGEGKAAALAAVAEHAAETGGDLAAGFAVARRMHYDAGLWLLPEVGESEAIEYHPDGSWTITAETGALYTVRYEWEGRDASSDLAPLLVEDETGALVASCTAVDGYMSAWEPMLERLRLHARAVADRVPHQAAVTFGGPGRSWVEAWCVCGWTERADVAEYADRAPAGEALALAHHRAHDPETSAADAHAFRAETEHAELPPSAIHDVAPTPSAPAIAVARAAAVDLAESAWGVECDRHGPVTVWVDMHGETCPQHRAGWCETRADAEHAAALHLDAHARRDADVMTPAEMERAAALGWSAAQSDIVNWVADGKVGEFPDGFFALDVAYDKPDVSRKLNRNRVLNLWASGRLLVDLDANGARRFTLSPETEAARKLYNQARRLGMIEAAAKDNSFGVSKAERDAYPLMSERRTFDGEEPWQEAPEHDVRIICHDGDKVSAYNRGHSLRCVCGWIQYRPEADADMAKRLAAEHVNPEPEEAPETAPVEELRAYMFNAGKAGLFIHVTGPREEHVSPDEHVATSASVESFKVEALTGANADTALAAAGWERRGPWDEDQSAPVQRAAPAAEADPAPVALPTVPLTPTEAPVQPTLPAGESAETSAGRTPLQVLETEETRPARHAPKRDQKPEPPEGQQEQGALFDLAQPEAQRPVTAPDNALEQDEASTARMIADRTPDLPPPGPGGDQPNTGEGGSSDADDRDGAIPDDRDHSTLNPLGVHASEPLVDEDAAAGPRPHPVPTPGASSPAVATAPPEDSRTPVPRARPADTPLRPGRLLHADGTPLVLHLSFPGKAATSHPVTAHGAAPAPYGTGEWQVVLDEKGSRMVVHPALISRQDTPRYPGVEAPEEVARWEALDRSEAIGEDAAVLPARYVRPGDRLAVTRSVKDKEVTEYLEVTHRRSHSPDSPGKRASSGLEFTLAGPRGGTRKVTHEPTAHVTIAHPTAHPAVTVPADGRPITTRLLRELWAEGPQIRQVHDPDTLQLIADGQFALHQQTDRSWELLPATTATVIWPSEYIYGFDGEPPWPLAGFPDADQAKEFANRLTTLLCNGGPGTIDFASPDFPATAQTWRSEDGAPLYLALLGERAAFDRSHGRADSHAATEYLKFESGTRRPQAPAGHQWADRLEAGDVILLEMDDELRPFDIRSRSISSSGLVTLVLDSDDTVLLARNMTVPSDATQPVTANGAAYADLQAGWAVPEGAWIELDPTDLDPELQRSLGHPQLREPGSRIRAKLSARDDDTYSIRLNQIRLVTADQERHTLAQGVVVEQPDLLVRLRPATASAEEAPHQPLGQTLTTGSQAPSLDITPAAASSRSTALPPADQQSAATATGTGAFSPEDGTPTPEADLHHRIPREPASQQAATPASPGPHPEPDKQRRAQEIADAATAATSSEQIRTLWESARSESLPPDTPVDTPDGTKPLRSYLAVRGQDLAARTAASDATPAAEHPVLPPDDTSPAAGTPEPPEPHNADMAEGEPAQEAALHELATLALGSEQAATAPTVLADLDGITIYHMVSAEPPEATDDHVGSRWLYLGLTDDTSNPFIPIAVISDVELSRIAAPDFGHAVSTWARAAEPVLVNLSHMAGPVGSYSQQEHHSEAATTAAKSPDEPAALAVDEGSIARRARQKLPELPQPAQRRPSQTAVTAEETIDEPRPSSISANPDVATPGHSARAHGGTGESDETQLAIPSTDVVTDADDSARSGSAQDNDSAGTSKPQTRDDSVASQRQSPADVRPEPTPARADLLQTHLAGTESLPASPKSPVAPVPASRKDGAALAGPNTQPGGNVGTVPEKQGIQVAAPTTEDGTRRIRDRLDQPEEHLSALRELFEALADSASDVSTSTANVSNGSPAAQETKPARPGLSTALTRARADLDTHIEAINVSPRTTPRIRTELGALIAQIDQTLPQLNGIHASQHPTLLNRALDLLVRAAARLKDLAARLHAPAASQRIEQLTERLRGSRPRPAASLLAPRGDQQLQAYATAQRTIETQLAAPGLPLAQRQVLQEKWIINRARWHNHYKIHHGEPPEGLIPHDGNRIAGYPTTLSLRPRIIRELRDHLRRRATDLASVPVTAAQAELFVILAAAYEKQLPLTSPTPASQPSLSTFRSQQAADRLDVSAAARRLAEEATKRAAHTAGAGPSPRTGVRTVPTYSEQQRAAHPASVHAGSGPSPT